MRSDEVLALACEYARQCAHGSEPIVDFDKPIELRYFEEGPFDYDAPCWEMVFQRAEPMLPSFIIVIVSESGKVQWHRGPYL